MTVELAKELNRIKPIQTATAVVAIKDGYDLFDIEERGILDALPMRKREFAAGRAAARTALQALDIAPQPIARAADRRPIWPEGIVGSISHSQGFAVAVVGLETNLAGVGLDIEKASPIKKELRPYILTPFEQTERDYEPTVDGSPRCTISFVAKEALFKCVYPITRKRFGFHEARIEIHRDGYWNVISHTSPSSLPLDLNLLNGRWAKVDQLIMAVISIKRTDFNPTAI